MCQAGCCPRLGGTRIRSGRRIRGCGSSCRAHRRRSAPGRRRRRRQQPTPGSARRQRQQWREVAAGGRRKPSESPRLRCRCRLRRERGGRHRRCWRRLRWRSPTSGGCTQCVSLTTQRAFRSGILQGKFARIRNTMWPRSVLASCGHSTALQRARGFATCKAWLPRRVAASWLANKYSPPAAPRTVNEPLRGAAPPPCWRVSSLPQSPRLATYCGSQSKVCPAIHG